MIQPLRSERWALRSQFFRAVRDFFHSRNYIEVETPLLCPGLIPEPFMDYFAVQRPENLKVPFSHQREFLPASPEANLKAILSRTGQSIFEISHSFRAGERSALHTEEFLLLEWYMTGANLNQLMQEALLLILHLGQTLKYEPLPAARQWSIDQLFAHFCGIDLDYRSLSAYIEKERLGSNKGRYDELFFLVFLHCIEPHLGHDTIDFIYDYPVELSALATIEENRARRCEIYWKGIELANGYQELLDHTEQEQRFLEADRLRQELGRPEIPRNASFESLWQSLETPVAGIAMGIERLLMIFSGETSLGTVSPFYRPDQN